jgi:hypothetical protein
MVDCHSRALCVGESVTALTGFCDENWGGRFVAHGKLWACFAEGKPMLSADVESHPNVAKSATLGWGTRPPISSRNSDELWGTRRILS